MKNILLLLAVICLSACVQLPNKSASTENAVVFSEQQLSEASVLDLLGNESATITITRIATSQGGVDAELAAALGVSKSPGKKAPSGVYEPSELELVLHQEIVKDQPLYSQLEKQLNPDRVMQPRANASFTVDFTRLTRNDVEFLPGKKRRTYFYEIGLSFKLLNAQGSLVYEREFSNFKLQVCIIENKGACLDVAKHEQIDPQKTWLKLVRKAFRHATNDTSNGLSVWAATLKHLKARAAVQTRSGRTISSEVDANYIRNKRLAEYPFLFLEIPNVKIDQLLVDLKERGAIVDETQREQLQNYITTAVRSTIDYELQQKIRKSGLMKESGIFLLPDTRAIWFKDALSRITADKINYDETELRVGDEDISFGADERTKGYGKPCAGLKAKMKQDLCLKVVAQHGKSQTHQGSRLDAVKYAKQSATFGGFLIAPPSEEGSTQLYPKSIAVVRKPYIVGSSTSENYIRVKTHDIKANDDRVYLRKVALDAAQAFAQKITENIILTFQEELAE
ncbi:MAG: hypothetical protein V3V31_09895 [Methylococcales bacterium]